MRRFLLDPAPHGGLASRLRLVWMLAAVAVLTAGAGQVTAASPAPPQTVPELPMIDPVDEASKAAPGVSLASTGDPDEDAVLAARRDIAAGGVLAVRNHEAALRKALSDMPNPFDRVKTVNGRTEYRADSLVGCLTFVGDARPKDKTEFVCKGNPYPSAALYLGSYFNEIGNPQEAASFLQAGLIAAPTSPLLISELGASLESLHRWPEALADFERGLGVDNLADNDRARLLRGRGFVLTELNRLDEAEASYRQSLTLAPGNGVALHELAYIASLRVGAKPTQGKVILPNAGPNPQQPAPQ